MARARFVGDIPKLPVELVLTPDEQDALFLVLYHISGSPSGPRGLIDGIRAALVAVRGEDEGHWENDLFQNSMTAEGSVMLESR